MAATRTALFWSSRSRWDWAAGCFGRHPSVLFSRSPGEQPRPLPVGKQKTTLSFLSRPDLPNLAYQKLKGKNPGLIFLPGYISNMSGTKALALEEFCKSLGHSYVRFDYSGCGSSDGNFPDSTIGKWRKDVLSIIDDLTEGPQAKKEVEKKGVWKMPTKYNEDGYHYFPYSFLKEAETHCLLHSPIPVNCPVRLLHGMKDDVIPWQVSLQVAHRVVSTDVDVILRKNGDHRMKEKDDLKLLVYTIDDLIDKLSTSGSLA
ncbi:palmitoyl-protein thioesterase ABHD10, mitochondrial isoform X2 [Tachyglossus aculeatus]|uniref:palmitoyl-protein thioesterase ABHD10, mitochondrial isoform X2 n=1 Tax=Tachyglossus aculeatus TaxID=9261 RepID=UPI0018F6F394|nr:palmitoyl-protein thioesterase ABHD10, mitochondrial isoform X2 [Tachyglossus aculeatus]